MAGLTREERGFRERMARYALKWCSDCKAFRPEWLFGHNKHNRDGLQRTCKACGSARGVARNAVNPERNRERVAAWRAVNPERKRETHAAWYAANRDAVRERVTTWRAANRDAVRERDRVRNATPTRRAQSRDHDARRRAAKAGIPSVSFDRTAYYGLPCYSCPAEADTHDHWFPLLGERTPLTEDSPRRVLPQCRACGAVKGNRDPLEWWVRGHRAFDAVDVVTDETAWLDCEPDWGHVAAGL